VRCVIPALLLAAALAAGPALGLYLVLAAIPVLAGTALAFYGDLVDGSADADAGALHVGLAGLALLLVVIGGAARANALDSAVPALGYSTVVGALGLLAIQSAVWWSRRMSLARVTAALRSLA
jgi:hypothetical protein